MAEAAAAVLATQATKVASVAAPPAAALQTAEPTTARLFVMATPAPSQAKAVAGAPRFMSMFGGKHAR